MYPFDDGDGPDKVDEGGAKNVDPRNKAAPKTNVPLEKCIIYERLKMERERVLGRECKERERVKEKNLYLYPKYIKKKKQILIFN